MISYILTAFFSAFLSSLATVIYLIGYHDFEAGGITLNGYSFQSAIGGDLFLVTSSPDNEQVVPAGAVLSAIRTKYWVGYYDGGCRYNNALGGRTYLKRIFFTISNEGISYYPPRSDDDGLPNYSEQIKGDIEFYQ